MNLSSGFAGDGILSCEPGIPRPAEPAEASEVSETAEAAAAAEASGCGSGKSAAWFGLDLFHYLIRNAKSLLLRGTKYLPM
jgi:hypothetical protein